MCLDKLKIQLISTFSRYNLFFYVKYTNKNKLFLMDLIYKNNYGLMAYEVSLHTLYRLICVVMSLKQFELESKYECGFYCH